MNGNYPGNSPGKDLARDWIYNQSTTKGYHVCIASHECGDVKYLLNKGVAKDKIIACDDPSSKGDVAREAAKQFEVVVMPRGSGIVETAEFAIKNLGDQIATINVDLCCNIIGAAKILKPILLMCQMLKDTLIFCVFSVGFRDGVIEDDYARTKAVSIHKWRVKSALRYQSSTAPMCVVCFHSADKFGGVFSKNDIKKV